MSAEVRDMWSTKFVHRTRAGLMGLLIALAMLFAAVPASADSDRSDRSDRATAQNVTWE